MTLTRRGFAGAALATVSGVAIAADTKVAGKHAGHGTAAKANGPGMHIPARFIPTPRSISPQAQAFLSAPVPAPTQYPALEDKAAWRALAKTENAKIIAATSQIAQAFPARTETHKLSKSSLYEVIPANLAPEKEDRVIFHIHGGGFYIGGGEAAVHQAQMAAGATKMRAFSVDYRMSPDHPFPAGLDDAVEAYRWVLKKYKPENIAFYGASAGGNLVAATVLKARDLGLPLPRVCVIHTPAADCTGSGDTFETNAHIDRVLPVGSNVLHELYAGDQDLTNPLLSPIYGDFSKGFPPTILTSGTRDLLLSSTVMLHRALCRGGIKTELHVWEAMPHGGFLVPCPEQEELMAQQFRFMHEHLFPA